MRLNFKKLLFAMLLPGIALAQAGPPSQALLSQEALFHRCYSHLTGKRPAANHALLAQVKANTLTAVDGCMQVLAKANLVPIAQATLTPQQRSIMTPSDTSITYPPYILRDVTDSEAVTVLNVFHSLHRMFFSVRDLSAIPGFYWTPDRVNDPTEPAVYLTRLMFQPAAQYREAVTGDYGVRGIRSLGAWIRTGFVGGSDRWNLPFAGGGLDRGELWGVGAYAPGNSTYLTDSGAPASTFQNIYNAGITFTSPRSHGGGIMGLSSFILMNSGFPNAHGDDNPNLPDQASAVTNATFREHRRMAKNVFSDLLCRSMPLLRADDVSNLVANYLQLFPNPATQVPFRVSSNCMSCHAALDPMAATFRSFFFDLTNSVPFLSPSEVTNPPGQTTNPNISFVTRPGLHSGYSGPLPAETPVNGELSNMPRDSNFYRRPATGYLRYRSYDGALIDQHFTATGELDGLSQMGTAMAQGNDLYVCAASRYFKYFTGIEVNLQDPGDPRNPALSADDNYYRNIVIQLGLSLKNHQSLTQLIREILTLPLYRKISKRDLVS